MSFPISVGAYQRFPNLVRYAADGSDESVSYRLTTDSGFVQATVYVYPSPTIATGAVTNGDLGAARTQNCAAQFDAVLRELASVHPRAQNVQSSTVNLPANDGAAPSGVAYGLVFTIEAPSAFGDEHPKLRSETSLYCYVGGRWNVKYRFTFPEAMTEEADISGFMRDLVWNIPGETT